MFTIIPQVLIKFFWKTSNSFNRWSIWIICWRYYCPDFVRSIPMSFHFCFADMCFHLHSLPCLVNEISFSSNCRPQGRPWKISLRSSYLNASAICIKQHFPDTSAPVAVLALKNHQAHSSFMHEADFFETSCLLEANNNGHIISCIISPYWENKTLWIFFANDIALDLMKTDFRISVAVVPSKSTLSVVSRASLVDFERASL